MADLTTLDPTLPLNSESAGDGASRIRDTRDAIINSFRLEHVLSGAHAFLRGNQGARPAAGIAGRIYLNTTDGRIERDDGSAWNIVNAVQAYAQYNAGGLTPSSSYVTAATVTIDLPPGGRYLVIALAVIALSGSTGVNFRITEDSVALPPADVPIQTTDSTTALNVPGVIWVFRSGGAPGSRVINFEIQQIGTGLISISKRQILVLVA